MADERPAEISPKHRIASLDGLRAVSILMVMIQHAAETLPHSGRFKILLAILGAGHTGVSIFFVISGYLITGLLLQEKRKTGRISLSRFYFRRTMRIFPPLYCYIAAVALLMGAGVIQWSGRDVLVASTFSWNYLGGVTWYLGHTWSLAIEEQFYLIWPALVVVLGLWLSGCFAVGIIAIEPLIRVATYFLFPVQRGRIMVMGHTRADMIAFGCAIALMERKVWFAQLLRFLDRWSMEYPAAVVLFLIDPLINLRGGESFRLVVGYTLNGICISLILLRTTRHPQIWFGRILNFKPIAFVGTISFSLYLWQQLFLTPQNVTWTGRFPINICFAFGLGLASFYLIERPVLQLRKKVSM